MEYVVGVALALVACALGRVVGLDRDRAFYPVMLMVIASYYVLFAVMGESALGSEIFIAVAFAAVGVVGFKRNLWLVVAALLAHGALDAAHHQFLVNDGVPASWPGFCLAFDGVAALVLASLLWWGVFPARPGESIAAR